MQIADGLGYRVEESPLIRTDLYLADEVFMVGTAAEVTPVRAVDDREIGVGPVTLELQQAYLDTVYGRDDRWSDWLDVVEMSRAAAEVAAVTGRSRSPRPGSTTASTSSSSTSCARGASPSAR